jgi:hypothetical protein
MPSIFMRFFFILAIAIAASNALKAHAQEPVPACAQQR